MTEQNRMWLDSLNPQQVEAATYGQGPLLVVAGAGTGKTGTLAARVAHLVSKGTAPERIMLLTFTRRAAGEMLKRAAKAIAQEVVATRVWGGTFHAISNRLLRIYGKAAGLSPDFTIMDRSDSEDFLNVVRNNLGLARTDKRFPRKSTCVDIYSRRVNGDENLEAVLKKYFPWCQEWQKELNNLFREYVIRKQERNVLDYDDLLIYWYQMVQEDSLAELLSNRFDHLLVDEYQDTNRLQAGISIGMRRTCSNITVVGNDAQSIYSFRAATVRNILDFPTQFPGTKVVTLEQNYRSVQPILETTNRIIEQAKQRYSKNLWSEKQEGQIPQVITCADENYQDKEVIYRILDHYEQGIPLKNQAVLFRASSNSASLELALSQRNIPFRKYGGLRFLEAAHIKDLVSILRILENPRDEIAWFRVLQLLGGVGPKTAESIYNHLSENGFDPCSIATFNAPSAAKSDISRLVKIIEELSPGEDIPPSVQLDRINEFYSPLLDKYYDNPVPRRNDIEHLAELATRYTTRSQFLAELVLEPPVSTGDFAGPPILDEDWLVLSTIHSAKGLEWDAVYLIHAADGCLPSDLAAGDDEEIEEELRLTYVAMTRAKDYLYVLWPMMFYTRPTLMSGNHVYAQLCRFFTPEVLETMEKVERQDVADIEDKSADFSGPDIKDRILGMWD